MAGLTGFTGDPREEPVTGPKRPPSAGPVDRSPRKTDREKAEQIDGIVVRFCLHVGDGILKQSHNTAHFDGIHAQHIGLR